VGVFIFKAGYVERDFDVSCLGTLRSESHRGRAATDDDAKPFCGISPPQKLGGAMLTLCHRSPNILEESRRTTLLLFSIASLS
jgi:hypothetical protein